MHHSFCFALEFKGNYIFGYEVSCVFELPIPMVRLLYIVMGYVSFTEISWLMKLLK